MPVPHLPEVLKEPGNIPRMGDDAILRERGWGCGVRRVPEFHGYDLLSLLKRKADLPRYPLPASECILSDYADACCASFDLRTNHATYISLVATVDGRAERFLIHLK